MKNYSDEAAFLAVDDSTPLGRKYKHEADEFLSRAKARPVLKTKITLMSGWKAVSRFLRRVDELEDAYPVHYYLIFFAMLAIVGEVLFISCIDGGWAAIAQAIFG